MCSTVLTVDNSFALIMKNLVGNTCSFFEALRDDCCTSKAKTNKSERQATSSKEKTAANHTATSLRQPYARESMQVWAPHHLLARDDLFDLLVDKLA